jgi:LysR family transcriptional regulator, glycine cleavage system transcriptional activator
MRRSSTLPPLPSLRAFAVVGRLLSFRKAGDELLITQSAVSHHVKQLEDYLGVALFVRHGRTISLTPAGVSFLEKVAAGFALIEAGARDLRKDAAVVRVSLLPSFAANWLVPRLPRFRRLYPEIVLDLDPTLEAVDLQVGVVDLAIRYGDGVWAGEEAELLMTERLTPVLSPTLLRSGRPLREPADLLQHTLLLTRNPFDWKLWAETTGLDFANAKTVQLVDYNVVLQAATEGQGVALGRAALVQDRLRSGVLVAPFPLMDDPKGAGYWLLGARTRLQSESVVPFKRWLVSEAIDFSQGMKVSKPNDCDPE